MNQIIHPSKPVAGEATRRSWVSKTKLIELVNGIRSPLISVRILLSSMTEFMDSIHIASMGPSNKIHFSAGRSSSEHCLKIVDKMPSFHSKVDKSYAPYSSSNSIDFGCEKERTFLLRHQHSQKKRHKYRYYIRCY